MTQQENKEFIERVVANISETAKVLPLDTLVEIKKALDKEIVSRDSAVPQNRPGVEL
jgi:hypothetical protein